MDRIVVACVSFVFACPAAAAQGVVSTVALPAAWAGAEVSTVEADGVAATTEFLAHRTTDNSYAVARAGCAPGAWFNPRAGLPVGPFSAVSVMRSAGRDYLVVRDGLMLYVVALVVPAGC